MESARNLPRVAWKESFVHHIWAAHILPPQYHKLRWQGSWEKSIPHDLHSRWQNPHAVELSGSHPRKKCGNLWCAQRVWKAQKAKYPGGGEYHFRIDFSLCGCDLKITFAMQYYMIVPGDFPVSTDSMLWLCTGFHSGHCITAVAQPSKIQTSTPHACVKCILSGHCITAVAQPSKIQTRTPHAWVKCILSVLQIRLLILLQYTNIHLTVYCVKSWNCVWPMTNKNNYNTSLMM